MTKEIKFRAWDKKSKQFVDDFVIDRVGNEYQTNKCEFWGDDREIVLMQFTGLKDKNGKEIYFEDYVEDEVGQIWIVKWNKTEIDLLNISTGDIMSIRNNLEIKSNIYENTFKFTPNYTEIS